MSKFKIKGFTLIELLVVIVIIGILSTLAMISLNSARVKARDAKRLSDIKQIASALDLYYADNNTYPTIITPGEALTSPDGSKVYMAKIPSNPQPRTDNGAPDEDYVYSVDSNNNNNSFDLSTSLGNAVGNMGPGRIGISSTGGGGGAIFACGQNITDADGNQYGTVQIGSQCWMKQNLNVGTMITSQTSSPCTLIAFHTYTCQNDDTKIEKYCLNNTASNCITYGGLYEWTEALGLPGAPDDCIKATSTDNGDGTYTLGCFISGDITILAKQRGICPNGWHIPTFAEFQTLVQNADPGCSLSTSSCITAGGKLKATSWDGTDDYGFSILPAGLRVKDGSFFGTSETHILSTLPGFSSSSESYSKSVYIFSDDTHAYDENEFRVSGRSVRCVKN